MFQIINSAELAALQDGVGIEGSLGVIYQLRDTGAYYVWNPTTRTMNGLSAAQVAATAALVSRAGNLPRRGTVGTRMFSMRTGAFDNSTVKTFRTILTLAQHFDRVRIIFANGSTSATYTVAGCNVRALADPAGALPSPTTVTLPSSGVVPVAASANRRSYLVSDWINLSSVDRSDGGTFPVLCVDAYVSTAGTITIMGNGTDSFTNWATRPNGRTWRMRYNDGDCVTTPASFVSTTDRSQSPIVGVQYGARGRVITVMGGGDSITDGRGTYTSEGWGVPAVEALSSMTSGAALEWCNLGWAGADAATFAAYLNDACVAGLIPDIAIFPNASPNSFSTPIVSANVDACRSALQRMLVTAREYQVAPIIWTCMPTNPAVKDYNSSDSLRRAWNAETLAWSNRGMHVLDFDAAMAGVTDGDGQVNMGASFTSDNIHPNDAGNAVLSGLTQAALREYIF